MASMFRVGVDIYLIDRISRDLGLIGRGFTGAQRRVQALQRSLNSMQSSHALHVQRARVTERIDSQGTQRMQQRLTLMQSAVALEQTEAADRARMGRIEAEQLQGLQRRSALQRVAAREQRDAMAIQTRQLQLSELQASINQRNTLAQLRLDETQNRLLRERQAIQARNLELAQAQLEANRQATITTLTRASIVGGIVTGVIGGLIKAGLPVGISEMRAGMAGGLSPAQANALGPFATNLAIQSRVFSRNQVLQALGPTIGAIGFGRTRALAGPFLQTAAIEQAINPGDMEDISETLPQLFQTATLLGARTNAQYEAFNRMVANVLVRSGGLLNLPTILETARTVGPMAAAMPIAGRMQLTEEAALLSARSGGNAALAPGAIGRLLLALQSPASGRNIALQQLLKKYGLADTTAGRSLPNILQTFQRLGASGQQIPLAVRIMAREYLPTIQALAHLSPSVLQAVMAESQTQVSTTQALAQALSTAQPQFRSFVSSMETLASVLGEPWAKAFGNIVNNLAGHTNALTRAQEGTASDRMSWLMRLLTYPERKLWNVATGQAFAPSNAPQNVTVHIHAANDPRETAKEVVKHLKRATTTHSSASPVGVSPALYGPRDVF